MFLFHLITLVNTVNKQQQKKNLLVFIPYIKNPFPHRLAERFEMEKMRK